MSKKGVVIHRQAREIISSVDKYFENEKEHANTLLEQLKQAKCLGIQPDKSINIPPDVYGSVMQILQSTKKVTERVTLATGVNKNTVTRIRREKRDATEASLSKIATPVKQPRKKNIICGSFEICALSNIINSMYTEKKEIPTLKNIYAAAKSELQFPGSLSTLRKIMIESLGYRFKYCQSKKSVLIQRPNIQSQRAKYLRSIRENDALGAYQKPVVYLHETSIHAHYTVKKCWQSTNAGIRKYDGVGHHWIITHAGTKDGFIEGALLMVKGDKKSGAYRARMSAQGWVKYVSEILIPHLPQASIIVMDHAPYHSVEETKPPNMGADKVQMHEWLTQNGIAYEPSFTKAELYELIKKHRPPKDYAIDNIFKAYGHEVLRLPPYNYDLNPLEYIWHLVKSRVADRKGELIDGIAVESLILESIVSIKKDDWNNEVSRVKRIEKQYHERAFLEDDDNGPFSIIVKQGDSSSSDDEEVDSNSSDDGMDIIKIQNDSS